jgi:NAD/NADP transhydrogenase alpha subunit
MADAGVSAFAMEVMPHHPRAGDGVLSSQANLAGYRAVIDAKLARGLTPISSQRDEAQSMAPLVGYTPPDSFP